MQSSKPIINPSIFREYDIRGIAGKDLSPEFAYHLGNAYARSLRKHFPKYTNMHPKIGVGRDCRLTGESYATALIQGLLDSGCHVVRIGVCPTPLTYFSLFHLHLDGAIMVTGSHNPSDYNGFKICMEKDTIHGKDILELRDLMEKGFVAPPGLTKGDLSEFDIIPAYIEHIVRATPNIRKMRIVLDAGNGTAATVAPPLFERLGSEVIPLFCELDGRFPNHHPDPTVPKNLVQLIEKVKETRANFGVAFDGDADRIGVVDEAGRIIYGDELMIILARAVLKTSPGSVVISEVKSSHRLYQDIAANGGKPIMWKTGHSLIKAKMKETKAALAGEMSGHIFFADRYFGYDDAIYAAVRFAEIASDAKGPVSSLLAGVTPVVATPEIRLDCEENKKFALVAETKKRLTSYQINDIDGVRVDFGDAWGLVRASNTQPVLVLRFEAPTEARLTEVRGIVEGALSDAAKQLGHPPLHASDH